MANISVVARARSLAVSVVTLSAVLAPLTIATHASPAAAANPPTTYTPGTPQLATITNGTSAAPWNEAQGDPASPTYTSQSPGTLDPYTPGGATTGSGATAEPNLAVYPAAGSGTDGVSPYPSGTVGTPGPLDDYCGSGNNAAASAGTPARQPDGTTLPFAPAYFPHVVRNGDGSLTGYFDYRPKDADEALVAAKSTDNGVSWTYEGEALEQNPGYCPNADTNDDGEGHANVITVGGVSRLYTLQRPAGDSDRRRHARARLEPHAVEPAQWRTGRREGWHRPRRVRHRGRHGSDVTAAVTVLGVARPARPTRPSSWSPAKFVDLTARPDARPHRRSSSAPASRRRRSPAAPPPRPVASRWRTTTSSSR